MSKEHECVDCRALPERPQDMVPGEEVLYGPEFRPKSPRPAPYGGPRSRRCTTHQRAHKRTRRQAARVKRSQSHYGLDPDDRADLLELQNGKCPICSRGLDMDTRGRFRLTAHDHDHDLAAVHDHPDNQACRECMRGLTCGWCNTELLSRIDLAAARRLVAYYEDPPMAQLRRREDDIAS